jgi:hypothetical protein
MFKSTFVLFQSRVEQMRFSGLYDDIDGASCRRARGWKYVRITFLSAGRKRKDNF